MPTLLQSPPDALRSTEHSTEEVSTQGAERLSYTAFRQMEFDDNDSFLYELLDGELVAKSAPSPLHQRVSGNIYFALRSFASQHNLGEVLYAPVDVFLDEHNAPQPDVLFLSNDKLHLVTEDGVQGAPDLVVEIISPSSIKRDRGYKMKLYERHGVGEYWLVDVRTRSVEVYVNIGQNFELREVFADEPMGGKVTPVQMQSFVVKEFTMPVSAVFAGATL